MSRDCYGKYRTTNTSTKGSVSGVGILQATFSGGHKPPPPGGPSDLHITSSQWPHKLQAGSKYGVFCPIFH
jgi:hypothetical protein